MHWSGAYDGFGTGTLDRDCDEMEALVAHLAAEGVRTVVLAGHSTGSQDVIHYLTSSRRKVAGGIMLSPASDREYFEKDHDALWVEQLALAEGMIAEGRGDQLMDDRMTEAFGARVTAYRLHSLIGVG
jgi:predicted alpha/beta hydrolase family esterase